MAPRTSPRLGRPGVGASWRGRLRQLGVLVGLVLVVGVLAPGTAKAQGESGSVTATVSVAAPAEACILISQETVDFGEVQFGQSASSAPDYDVVSCSAADQSVYAATSHAKGTASAVSWQPTPGPLTGVNLFAVDAALDGQAPVWLGTDPAPVAPLAAGAAGQAAHTLVAPTPGSAGAGEELSFELTWIATHETPPEPAWTPQTSGSSSWLRGVDFVNADRGWTVGSGGTILTTTDGGDTWTPQVSGTTNVLYDVVFVDADRGWAVGINGTILTTSNGGDTWTAQVSGTGAHLNGVAFVDANRGWAVGQTGTILATSNGGDTWTAQVSGTGQFLFGVTFLDADRGWAVGAGRILSTVDGGSTWVSQAPTSVNMNGVSFVDADRGWAVGNSGTILVTDDGGANWAPQVSGTTNQLEGVAFVDADRGWAVGFFGTILVTADGGATWTTMDPGTTASLMEVAFVGADRGWAVGTGGTILAFR
jgi:photosystem II stability/assembly factor-like uncharacterized protein